MKLTVVSMLTSTCILAVGFAFCFTLTSFAQDKTSTLLRVAVYRDAGASDTCANATREILDLTQDCKADFISSGDIQNGVLKDYDVVFFPGGSASAQRKALGDEGWKRLWSFLEDGGGYVGTCAGAYLALYSDSRLEGRLINAELQEGEWERGEAILEIELTEEGREILGDYEGRLNIAYQNGPIFHPANYSELEPYRVLAFFRSEIAENDAPKGVQINSPAIAVGEYGKGRVVILSPHPELTPKLNSFVPKIARYASKK